MATMSTTFTVIMFCLASVIFPIGFMIEEIGGQAFQLPQDHTVSRTLSIVII